MPPLKDLLHMLPMAMALDTMASAMLMLTLLSSMEDMQAMDMDMLLCLLPLALVLTPSHRVLMPPLKDLLPMLPMAMVLDTMASVMLMLTQLSSMEDMLAMAMQDIPMPMGMG